MLTGERNGKVAEFIGLTTVRQPLEESGRVAVELLLIAGILSYSSFLHGQLAHAIGITGVTPPGWSYFYWLA
ncbi:MAG: hypothetical protein WCL13_04365, partial [bacterium]